MALIKDGRLTEDPWVAVEDEGPQITTSHPQRGSFRIDRRGDDEEGGQ